MLLSVYNIKKRDLNLLNGKLWLKRYFYWNKNLSFNGIWISTQAQPKRIVSWCHFIPPIFYSISNLINICIIPIYFLVGLWGCEACCRTVFFTPHIQYESFFYQFLIFFSAHPFNGNEGNCGNIITWNSHSVHTSHTTEPNNRDNIIFSKFTSYFISFY